LSPSDEGAAADWLTASLWPWPNRDRHVEVGSLVPEGFSAYLAIRHRSGHEDDLSLQEASVLATVLAEFTARPDDCWFCVWDGYGDLAPLGADHAVVRKPGREYRLYRGPLAAVTEFPMEQPQLWWPADRAWCVGSDMDLTRTFVGGSEECAAELEARAGLDVQRVDLDFTVDGTNELLRLSRPQ
jgi:hypothetical protein